jgi:hypothetical protein
LNQTLAINRQFPFIDLLKFYDVPAGVQAQNRADDDLVPAPPGRLFCCLALQFIRFDGGIRG